MGCSTSKGGSLDRADIRGVVKREPEAGPGTVPRVKLVLLGDSGVGKSCLVLRYVRGQFDPTSKVTVGAAFMSHSVHLPEGQTIKFEIWDTAGQERYASLAPLYYRGASAAAIVYDITNPDSFQKAKYWTGELQKNAAGDIAIILVANKTDLAELREVSLEEGREYADANGMMFVETSAKTAACVTDIFEQVARKIAKVPVAQPGLAMPAAEPSAAVVA